MASETERKYLIDASGWQQYISRSLHILQGYVTDGGGDCEIRIRCSGPEAWITIKDSTQALTRREFEYSIPLADAKEMLDGFTRTHISKVRHELALSPGSWTVDEFSGKLDGLLLLEIEGPELVEPPRLPDWVRQEVTDDARYRNAHLSRALSIPA